MCGRVNVHDNEAVRMLLAMMGMTTWPSRDPRFNIAPTQPLDVIVMRDEATLATMSWGVSMHLRGKTGKPIVKRVSNARSDKVWSSPLWRSLIPAQRVLIPVNGFYEWVREKGKPLQAWYITPSHDQAMFLAGIYRPSNDQTQGAEVSIVTTEANRAMSAIHDRMPVILSSVNEANAWIGDCDRDSLDQLMQPANEETLCFTPVSDHVNKAGNEGPECITRVQQSHLML